MIGRDSRESIGSRETVHEASGRAELYRSHYTPAQLRAHALRASARGLRVFPVRLVLTSTGNVNKLPMISGYHGDRAFADSFIRSMPWSARSELGIALGWALPTSAIALDVDVKDGKLGLEHLQLLEGMYGSLPESLRLATPSSGFHLPCGRPAGLINVASRRSLFRTGQTPIST